MRLRCASAVRALPQEEEERGRRGGHADTGGVDGRLGQRSGRDGERGPAPPLSDRSTRCVLVSRSDARCLEPSAFRLQPLLYCLLRTSSLPSAFNSVALSLLLIAYRHRSRSRFFASLLRSYMSSYSYSCVAPFILSAHCLLVRSVLPSFIEFALLYNANFSHRSSLVTWPNSIPQQLLEAEF